MYKAALKKKVIRIWREWVRPLAVIIIACGSFRSAVADWNDVPTGSMDPTIVPGDRIFVNKMAYSLRVPFTSWRMVDIAEPQRGDIAVFFSPDDNVRMVKRVIGLPGDRIELRNNRLIINGKPVAYGPMNVTPPEESATTVPLRQYTADEMLDGHVHTILQTSGVRGRRNFGPYTVPRDRYFMMGDNRDNSRDSRWYGAVARDAIVGRASTVVFSLDREAHFLPRMDRFLHSLE